ncbi:unnamed protein product [Sphenostylis stenocarpa]|uniref:Uncharacterized protein n=1 Tax=Sphenostylis stenocarpa TaxID=92480 RepID=A0AA86RSC9_9FABA|nr:unnamed protein product [Sphenostylis stenocarpa]
MKKPIPGLLFSDASYVLWPNKCYLLSDFLLTAPMLLARHFMSAFTIPPWLLSTMLLLKPVYQGSYQNLTGKPPLENLNKHADGCAAGVATEELSESCSSGKDR